MTIAKVQASVTHQSTGTTVAIPAATYTAGNLITFTVTHDSANTTPVLTDTTHSVVATRKFTKAGGGSGTVALSMFGLGNIAGGSTAFSLSGVTVGGSIVVQEWSNITALSDPSDQFISNAPGSGSVSHSTGTTPTTTQANELILAGDGNNQSNTAIPSAVSNSFTLAEGENNGASFWTCYTAWKEVVATGTQTTTFTWTDIYSAGIVTFKAAVGGAASDIPTPLRGLNYSTLVRL
jgi:hypothetical protein